MLPCAPMIVHEFVLNEIFVEEKQTVVKMGGNRNVVAVIKDLEDSYEIEISFIPVRCFDPALNKKISQEKANAFVDELVLNRIGNGDFLSVMISGRKIKEEKVVGDKFVSTQVLAKKSIIFSNIYPEEKNAGSGFKMSVLKAKVDYQQTIGVITKLLESELPIKDVKIEDLYKKIGELEEVGMSRFDRLEKEVEKDRWILNVEKEEIIKNIQYEEKRFMSRLRIFVEKVEGNEK